MATYVETIKYPGQSRVTTLNGTIALEEATGRLVIRDPVTGQPRNVQDYQGSYYNDEDGRLMTLVDTRGINTVDPDTGIYRGRWGITTTDDSPLGAFTKDGEDIRSVLGEQ